MPRTLLLLLLVFVGCWALSWLPSSIFGQKIKKVDLLADLRPQPADTTMDQLRAQLNNIPLPDNSEPLPSDTTSLSSARRDSLVQAINKPTAGAYANGERIEDYTDNHSALQRFFKALRTSRQSPVRIAFLGDSFIEGDILVGDFRNTLQKNFGGHGVGFVPISSVVAQYRSTVLMKSSGWKTLTLLTDRQQSYAIPGQLFETTADIASLYFQNGSAYSTIQTVSTLKLIYDRCDNTFVQLILNAADTMDVSLPPTDKITQYTFNADTIRTCTISFSDAKNLRALGVALEEPTGVTVDNHALRGNSGLPLANLDPASCQAWNEIRPYDLIILQYGLNVADENTLDYNWYASRMTAVVNSLRDLFPMSDILLLGVSDRCSQYDGDFKTIPAVLALLNAQRRIARQARIAFWNTFGAMGGENSMTHYVANGWAGKDYTHLTYRGGSEISKKLLKALMKEKEYYDNY